MTPGNPQPLFLPYQRRWIEDPARLKIMEKSRQVGMTWASAYSCVRRLATAGNEREIWVASRDELQAKLFLEDCRRFAAILGTAAEALHERLFGTAPATAMSLTFNDNRRLHSLSSNPDAQAGKRGSRLLDEFALHPDPRRLYAIATPGITWGGRLEILSTHRGRHDYFNTLGEEARGDNPNAFSLHRVTLQDALEQGLLTRLKAKLPADDPRQGMDEADYFDFIRNSCPDEATFQQEYQCNPADDSDAFLSWDIITACEAAAPPVDALDEAARSNPRRRFYLGVDIGRDRDLTVFWLLERVEDLHLTRAVRCLANTPFAQQEAVLDHFMQARGMVRACIDQTGLGRQFAERAARRYGTSRVEGVTFTPGLKEALAYPLRGAFEDRRLRIPAQDALRADLRSVRLEPSTYGALRFRSGRANGSHADRFWALALAYRASSSAVTDFHYSSLGGFSRR